jgi:hypothetical protein
MGWVTKGTLSRWSRLHLQSLAHTNPHWARVVGYGPFSLWLIHKEGLCPSSRDINRLMMMMITFYYQYPFWKLFIYNWDRFWMINAGNMAAVFSELRPRTKEMAAISIIPSFPRQIRKCFHLNSRSVEKNASQCWGSVLEGYRKLNW